nr:MAG TPA: hypothetical protein [Caudoviricetes sp.]
MLIRLHGIYALTTIMRLLCFHLMVQVIQARLKLTIKQGLSTLHSHQVTPII